MDLVIAALQSGFASLAAYLAAHVLLCLMPAFFIAGALSALMPQAAITRYLGPDAPRWVAYPAAAGAGSNTVAANLAGVVFGVFMYFPTLVEVPIAKMFLSLGMHPGPLIAYLMADPELSLQSILITSAIIGKLKAWTYVGLVALFSTLAGLAYGAWVDGTPLGSLALIVGGFIVTLMALVHFIEHRRRLPAH